AQRALLDLAVARIRFDARFADQRVAPAVGRAGEQALCAGAPDMRVVVFRGTGVAPLADDGRQLARPEVADPVLEREIRKITGRALHVADGPGPEQVLHVLWSA